MPAIAAIALADGKATPVTHTFAPVTTNGSAAELANRAASIPQGFEELDVEVRQPSSPTGSYRVEIDMVFPVVATVNGVDTVVRTSKMTLVYNASQLTTAAERKDHRVLMQNCLANSLVTQVIENLEPLY
nr:MAG: hypothetical protein 2 [Leviviridae sp.]